MEKEDDISFFVGGPLDGQEASCGLGEPKDRDYLMAFAKSKVIHAYRWTGSDWQYAGTRQKPRADEQFLDQ